MTGNEGAEGGAGGRTRPDATEPDTPPAGGATAGRTAGSGSGDGAVGGGAVHIGSMSGGAIATGAQGRATSTSYTYAAPPQQTDEATRALLEAVRALRGDMRVLAAGDETRAVDGELGEVEDEITRTGHADPGRLARLRERLEPGASAIGVLASAATVVQAVAQVLG